MKKFMSFMLAVIMTVMLFVMPVFADDSYGSEVGTFEVLVSSGEEWVDISWGEVSGADHYTLWIQGTEGDDLIVEDIKGTGYKWEPGYYVDPYTVFYVTVNAYDKDNTLISESVLLSINVNVAMWDYWGKYGDVDLDNDVSVMDATYVQNYLAGLRDLRSYRKSIGDVHGDGVISIFDATYIQFFCAEIYIEDNRTFTEFWEGGIYYDIVIVESYEPPTVGPTVEEPTDPTTETPEPTDPYNLPVATSSPIVSPF